MRGGGHFHQKVDHDACVSVVPVPKFQHLEIVDEPPTLIFKLISNDKRVEESY